MEQKHLIIRISNNPEITLFEKETLMNKELSLNINNFFADNYYINIESKSSIRYLLNYMIMVCDWNSMITTKTAKLDKNKEEEGTDYLDPSNTWIERLNLLNNSTKIKTQPATAEK